MENLTIESHLIKERPNFKMALYLLAANMARQKDSKNPIQLKRNTMKKGNMKMVGQNHENHLGP